MNSKAAKSLHECTSQFTRPLRYVVRVWPAAMDDVNSSFNGQCGEIRLLTAAARSICPPIAEGFAAPPTLGLGAPAPGRGAAGMGGFAPTFGGAPTEGFAATGGGGFGFAARGGFGAAALAGLDVAGVLSFDEWAADAVRFHGAAEPFAAAIPGKTATGAAWGLAATDLSPTFGAA